MDANEQRDLARQINAALRGEEPTVSTERPAALPLNATEAQRQKHAADSVAYAQDLVNRRGALTQEEQIFLAQEVAKWNREGRP